MDAARTEVASQPELWQAAVELAGTADVSLTLPHAGERVAVVGHGSCLRMARAYASLRIDRGLGETVAFEPGEVDRSAAAYDRFVIVSTHGERQATIDVILTNQELAVVTTAITSAAASRVAELSGHTIVLEHTTEHTDLPTRFASTALALLRAHAGEDLGPVIADARTVVTGRRSVMMTSSPVSPVGWAEPLAEEIDWWRREVGGGSIETSALTSDVDPMVALVAAQRDALRRHRRRRPKKVSPH